MSPLLFNILVADIEKEIGKIKWGEVQIGRERVYTMPYADDVVLVAKGNEMRSMVERSEGYLDEKRLELNTDKTKTMRFRRGERQ